MQNQELTSDRDPGDEQDGDWFCPYCRNWKPSGIEVEQWQCCGEIGHAVNAQEQKT